MSIKDTVKAARKVVEAKKIANNLLETPGAFQVAVEGNCAKSAGDYNEFKRGLEAGSRKARREEIVIELATAGVHPSDIREVLGILEIW
jgi:hypothetical protein